MNRLQAGRWLMTFVLTATSVLSFLLDWSDNHLLNPAWHPHARFHGALLLFMLAGVSGTALRLLWRKSAEPEVMVRAAGMLSLAFWTPLFYITMVLPSSTSWAGAPEADPRLTGAVVTPNLLVAGIFVAFTLAAIGLSWHSSGADSLIQPGPVSRNSQGDPC
jgi:hypothetical protein